MRPPSQLLKKREVSSNNKIVDINPVITIPLVQNQYFMHNRFSLSKEDALILKGGKIELVLRDGVEFGRTLTSADLKNFIAVLTYAKTDISYLIKKILDFGEKEERLQEKKLQLDKIIKQQKKYKNSDYYIELIDKLKREIEKEEKILEEEAYFIDNEFKKKERKWCVEGAVIPIKKLLKEYKLTSTVGGKSIKEFKESLEAIHNLQVRFKEKETISLSYRKNKELQIESGSFYAIPRLFWLKEKGKGKKKGFSDGSISYVKLTIDTIFFKSIAFNSLFYLNSDVFKKLKSSAFYLYLYLEGIKIFNKNESIKRLKIETLINSLNLDARVGNYTFKSIANNKRRTREILVNSLDKLVEIGFLSKYNVLQNQQGEEIVEIEFPKDDFMMIGTSDKENEKAHKRVEKFLG